MADTLSTVVDKAVEETIKNNPAPTVPVNGEIPIPDDKKPEEKKESKPEDLSDDDLVHAKLVWKTLKAGGEDAAMFIDGLAKKNGYSKIETKIEAKEAVAGMKDVLQEALGEEYGHLAGKLVPALKEYVAQALKEGTADLHEKVNSTEIEKLEARSDATFTELSEEYYEGKGVPTEVDTEMASLMKKYRPSEGQGIEEYVKDIFHLATSKLGKTPLNKASQKAAAAARANVPAILDSTKGRPISNGEVLPRDKGERMTVDAAVRSAVAEVNKSMERN